MVSLAEAVQRNRLRQPVVRVDFGPNRAFKFSLAPGDILELDTDNGRRELFVVRGTTYPQVALAPISDARQKDQLVKDHAYLRLVANTLRKKNARKVFISPLGETGESHE